MNSNDEKGKQRRAEDEKKLQALRAALIEGEQSGPSTPFDFDVFVQDKRRKRNDRSR